MDGPGLLIVVLFLGLVLLMAISAMMSGRDR